MKKINVTPLTGTLGAPFLKQTFVHTDEQVAEVVDALVKGLIGAYTDDDLIILHGCVITGTTTKAITAGAIYYNGEVYLVDAASGLTGGAGWIFAIVTTYAAGDPVTYDDATTHNQHQIDKIVFQIGDSGSDGYIADWDAATVKAVSRVIDISAGVSADIFGRNVTVKFLVDMTGTTTTGSTIFTLPSNLRNAVSRGSVFIAGVYQAGGGSSQYNLSVAVNINTQVGVATLSTDMPPTTDIIHGQFTYNLD